jgi:hypothetical protein
MGCAGRVPSLCDPGAHVRTVEDRGKAERANCQTADVGPAPFLAWNQDAERGIELLKSCPEAIDSHGLVASRGERGKDAGMTPPRRDVPRHR